jgi:AcrR family transcriptional regulator
MVRTGRRPGESGAREAILDAARRAFSEHGYEGATIRGIAARAGVDPALVHHFYGSKEQLFATAMELPFRPSEIIPTLLEGGPDGLGERILRLFLPIWDEPGVSPFVALIRSASSNQRAAAMLRKFMSQEVIGRLARRSEPLMPSSGLRSSAHSSPAWQSSGTSFGWSRSRPLSTTR